MEERTLTGKFLTPLFSYGAYNRPGNEVPEFRSQEFKGMMRYCYRIIRPVPTGLLAQEEADLFGGCVGKDAENQGHASPIQIILSPIEAEKKKQKLLFHKEENNPELQYFFNSPVTITLRQNKRIVFSNPVFTETANLDWYQDLAELALMLCGMGKRSRKGRGRIAIDSVKEKAYIKKKNAEEALYWICNTLNRIANITTENKSGGITEEKLFYQIVKGKSQIQARNYQKAGLRPVIQKIQLGTPLSKDKMKDKNKHSVSEFLRAVDKSCHEIKWDASNGNGNKPLSKVIGSSGGRFASSLLIGFLEIEDGTIYPIYTFVKAVKTNPSKYELDPNCSLREEFIQIVKNKLK